MIKKVSAFTFLILCYFLVMSTIFTIKYCYIDPDSYGTIFLTSRKLFEYMINCGFEQNVDFTPGYFGLHTVLICFHTFVSHVFLENFIIALINTVYKDMIEIGEYGYKSYKYKFYEKLRGVL